jgi:eukaryotic-like serine/threonine-protein kinase
MSLEPGRIIEGRIRLERVLGKGGMGNIWVAEHLALKTRVAVKFMAPEIAEIKEARARFEQEASAAAQIKSPHVVHISDHGITADGFPYIVMELLEGEDLWDRLVDAGPLDLRTTVAIVAQVCKALDRAHARGIVHRDIKPSNIFLLETPDREPFAKLLDFGIAKRISDDVPSETPVDITAGTPQYMSPEQIVSAKQVDSRTDLWSLGVVAYEMLTGRVPFEGDSLGAVAISVNAGSFAPPSHHRPDLPPAVDAWFERALARSLEARFASAKQMSEALLAAVRTPGRAARAVDEDEPASSRGRAVDAPKTDPLESTTVVRPLATPVPQRRRGHWRLGVALVVIGALAFMGALALGIAWFRISQGPHGSVEPEASDPAAALVEPAPLESPDGEGNAELESPAPSPAASSPPRRSKQVRPKRRKPSQPGPQKIDDYRF